MEDVILISSESNSNDSDSPPTKGSYLSDTDNNSPKPTDFWGLGGLGSSRGDRSLTKEHISSFNIRNVHDLSDSDSNEEAKSELSPRPRATISDEDTDPGSPCWPPIGLGLGLTANWTSPSESDLTGSKTLPGFSKSDATHNTRPIPISPDSEGTYFQPLSKRPNYVDDLECKLRNENQLKPSDKKSIAEQKRHAAKIVREMKQAERVNKLAEQAQVKASKQASAKARQLLKPEECIKHLSAIIDKNVFEHDLCGNLYNELEALGVTYTVQSQVVPLTVSWMRQVGSTTPDGGKEVQHEQHSLLILPCSQLTQLIQRRGLCDYVQGVQAIAPKNNLTLIIHGTGNLFRSQKKTKDKDKSNILQEDVTEALVEVQLFANCDHRFVESCLELATTISQFSKAIAEIPFRLEKQKKESDKLEWFGESDSKDCVRVDKNGNGLMRLWKQQLCEFNLAGLQMAEAITSVYPSPQALFQAYDSCSSKTERETMLQDVPIRRGVGALSSVRRIGPELSKKLHIFFTTLDGEVDLSNE